MRVVELESLGIWMNVLVVRMWPLRVSNPSLEVEMKKWQPVQNLCEQQTDTWRFNESSRDNRIDST